MTTRYDIELDVADEGDTVEEIESNLMKAVETVWKLDGVTVKCLTVNGPAGGNPIVKFTTEDPSVMQDIIMNYVGGDMHDAVYYAIVGVTRTPVEVA